MKKTVNVAIGGRSFILDEDSHEKLRTYLDRFRASIASSEGADEVMDEVEMRIADLFKEKLRAKEVVDIRMVDEVIAVMGLPDSSTEDQEAENTVSSKPKKKFYRDADSKVIFGVCSGIATYFDIDVVLVRIVAVVALIFGSAGGWIYLIVTLVAPKADTAVRRCELRGIPATAENIRIYSSNKN